MIEALAYESKRISALESRVEGYGFQIRDNTVAVESMARALQGLGNVIADLNASVKSMQRTLIERDVEEVLGPGVKKRRAR
jgi:hypothetical protein